MLNRRADKLELLRIAEAVALEKSIDKELIIDSMENGIAKAAKSKFGSENEIKVLINRENGDIGIYRKLTIVENPENTNLEISLKDAANLSEENKDKKLGDEILQPLPSFDFGRIAAQTAKQVITFNVREAERERQFNDFIDKKDTILSGIVKRLEFGNVIVDLGRTEAIIQKNELIPKGLATLEAQSVFQDKTEELLIQLDDLGRQRRDLDAQLKQVGTEDKITPIGIQNNISIIEFKSLRR